MNDQPSGCSNQGRRKKSTLDIAKEKKAKGLTRDDIILPVLAAWAHEEISIGRARELLHWPDDKIRKEAERRVSSAVQEKEHRDILEQRIQDLGMMLRRALRRLRALKTDAMQFDFQARELMCKCGVDDSPIRTAEP